MLFYIEDAIREETREAKNNPLKLEILAELYYEDMIKSRELGFNVREKIYKKAYANARELEAQAYEKMPPLQFPT